jgi:hypothetical protein
LSSLITLDLFLIFEIRGVLSLKTCLEGGNLVNLTIMHHDASRDAPPTSFIKPHAKDKNGWGASIALQEIHGGM